MIGPERRGDVIEAGVAYLAPHAARVHEDPEPEAEHIPTFLFVIPGDHPWTDRRIMKVREPEWQRSWAVQIGRNVAFLPLAGDTTLYERLSGETRNGQEPTKITFNESCEWPSSPSFGLRPGSES